MAYIQLYYHIIWRTKDSVPAITEEHERDLYKFIWGTISNTGSHLYRINSMPDHVHMLVEVSPSVSLADFMKTVKLAAGNYMRDHAEHFPNFKGWGKSYCAITYCKAERDTVMQYIANQKEHHKQESFADEFERILREEGVDYNPAYLLSE